MIKIEDIPCNSLFIVKRDELHVYVVGSSKKKEWLSILPIATLRANQVFFYVGQDDSEDDRMSIIITGNGVVGSIFSSGIMFDSILHY